MASLIDIFNPSFFMFLGILVLVAALIVVYFESKLREQNHKMTSMLSLVTCIADEMNHIKSNLNQTIGGSQIPNFQSANLETNISDALHNLKSDLINVSDDSDSEDDIENDSKDSDSEDSDSEDSDSEDNGSEDSDHKIIEISEVNDIKILKLNISSTINNSFDDLNDIENDLDDIDDLNDIENDLEDLEDLNDLCEEDDSSVSSNKNNQLSPKKTSTDQIISDFNFDLKTINISSLEEVKSSDFIDYKKFTLNKLRSTVVEKKLVDDSSKLKKNELLKLLGAE